MKRRFILTIALITTSVFALSDASEKMNAFRQYKDIEVKSIFGFEFGSVGSNRTVKLAKPFRYFTDVDLKYTSFQKKLFCVESIGHMPEGSTSLDAFNESKCVKNIFEKKCGIKMKGCLQHWSYRDANIQLECEVGANDGRFIRLCVCKDSLISDDDEAQWDFERRKKSLALPPNVGTDVLGLKVHSCLLEPLIPMKDALTLAQRGDGRGYFQLALHYYMNMGLGRREDTRKMAFKFLKKAYDMSYPNAMFCVGLMFEDRIFSWDRSKRSSRSSIKKYFGIDVEREGISSDFEEVFDMPLEGKSARVAIENATNEIVVAAVYTNYNKAVSLGVLCATNEISRFNARMVGMEEQVKLNILSEEIPRKYEEERRKVDAAAKRLITAENSGHIENENLRPSEGQRIYKDWPRGFSDEEFKKIYSEATDKFGSVYLEAIGFPASRELLRNREWVRNQGKSVVVRCGIDFFLKFNMQGVLEYAGKEPEEIKWINERKKEFLKQKKEAWAKEHNMTVEEAERKYEEFSSRGRRPGLLNRNSQSSVREPGGSLDRLRQRRMSRVAEEAVQRQAAEKARADLEAKEKARREREQAAADREQQREALLQIQEELRRLREAKEKSKSK